MPDVWSDFAEARPYLVAASSGRALAASAARGGFRTVVLDLFGDLDLDRLAAAHLRVPRTPRGGFDPAALIDCAERLAPARSEPPFGIVYGSGFEAHPALLARLSAGRVLFGNEPGTLAAVKDPRRFFARLEALGVPYPETRFDPPARGEDEAWLVKNVGGAGGIHIRHAVAARARRGGSRHFYQRFVEGQPVSALLLCAGGDAAALGLTIQWPAPGSLSRPFRFGGAAGPAALAPSLARAIEDTATAIGRAFALKGLNSVDFIVAHDRFVVVEINPRPGASLDVYERGGSAPLFALHVAACAGLMAKARFFADPGRGFASVILYAEEDMVIPPAFEWPEWTTDRPRPGTVVRAGAPLCTVFAEAAGSAETAAWRARELGIQRGETLRATIRQCMHTGAGRP